MGYCHREEPHYLSWIQISICCMWHVTYKINVLYMWYLFKVCSYIVCTHIYLTFTNDRKYQERSMPDDIWYRIQIIELRQAQTSPVDLGRISVVYSKMCQHNSNQIPHTCVHSSSLPVTTRAPRRGERWNDRWVEWSPPLLKCSHEWPSTLSNW